MDSKIQELKRVPLFSRLSKQELEVLASNMDELSFPPGTDLISQGSGNHTFYLLTEGQAEVLVEGEHRRDLGPGDFFGEISMQERTPATATVRSKTAVMALVMSHDQYRAVRGNPHVSEEVTRVLGQRLAADQPAN
jgi:CRP-like cAMP-binding protein